VCATPLGSGLGSGGIVAVTGASLVGTDTALFSFDAPAISHTDRENSATTGSSGITLSGENFGASDLSGSASIGGMPSAGTVCQTSAWSSPTGLVCSAPAGSGLGLGSVLATTASSLVGTDTAVFTFDAPVVSHTDRDNGPTSGSGSITLSGENFGASDLSGSASAGGAHSAGTVCTPVGGAAPPGLCAPRL
jgi:hypothetical protein